MTYIWVYKPAHLQYFIAKRQSFGFYTPVLDRTGATTYNLQQGVAIPLPSWEWKTVKDGFVFAGFSGNVYEISDLKYLHIPSCPH